MTTSRLHGGAGWWKSPCPDLERAQGGQLPRATRQRGLRVAAAASFYGGGIAAPHGPGGQASPIQRTNKIKGRILCLFGGKDSMIPQSEVAAIRCALEEHSARHEIVVSEGADHGFPCD